jgi:subtilisin family serine protease
MNPAIVENPMKSLFLFCVVRFSAMSPTFTTVKLAALFILLILCNSHTANSAQLIDDQTQYLVTGNDSTSQTVSGGYGPVGVAALNRSGTSLARFSNSGYIAQMSAPGELIYCSDQRGRVVVASGTSFAAANAAGVASIILGVNPNLKSMQALYAMREIDGLGTPPVNALRAVKNIVQTSR